MESEGSLMVRVEKNEVEVDRVEKETYISDAVYQGIVESKGSLTVKVENNVSQVIFGEHDKTKKNQFEEEEELS